MKKIDLDRLAAEGKELERLNQAGKDYRSINEEVARANSYRQSGIYKFDG
jgi:hypothetical protein